MIFFFLYTDCSKLLKEECIEHVLNIQIAQIYVKTLSSNYPHSVFIVIIYHLRIGWQQYGKFASAATRYRAIICYYLSSHEQCSYWPRNILEYTISYN